jgi:type II secretory pathway predicted ATPase ExeA/murein L,D-transpeptidase YcbB/YkuD
MYNKFFGFKEKPFKLVPNPEYLFLSKSHEEALAHLTYAVSQGDGFVEITGEVGTGKTTLCRAFLDGLDRSVEAAYIFNPKLDSLQLLKSINDEFGIDSEPDNIKELIDILNTFLIEQKAADKKVIILIDEAQNLSMEVLEQLRLLSNLETTQEKLLQIILVGQPELGEALSSYELRQLGQRITINCNLQPLGFQETIDYIRHRISLASHRAGPQFNQAAYKAIFKYSGGIPRLINIVCDRALLNAFSQNSYNITGAIAKEAIKELAKMNDTQPSPGRQTKPAFAVLASLLIIALVLLLHFSLIKQPGQQSNIKQVEDSHKATTDTPDKQIPTKETVAAAPTIKTKLEQHDVNGIEMLSYKDTYAKEAENEKGQAAEASLEKTAADASQEKKTLQKAAETIADEDQRQTIIHSVHAGSFRDLDQADKAVEELRANNYPSFLYTDKDARGDLIHIVVAGKYASEDEAIVTSMQLNIQGYDTFVSKSKHSLNYGPPLSKLSATPNAEAKNFQDFLYGLNARFSRNSAMQEALKLWSPEVTLDKGFQQINADRIFFNNASDHYGQLIQPIAADLLLIQRLNLPTILAIYLPNHLWPKYLTIKGIAGDQVVFASEEGHEPLVIDWKTLQNYWSGEAYLLWKNYLGIEGTITKASHNESVRALKQLLYDQGNEDIIVNKVYDDKTQQIIKDIQKKYGLREDGKVGPLTKIALYNESERFQKPSLTKLTAELTEKTL